MKYSINTIQQVISAEKKELFPAEVSILLTDSRNLSDASQTLFFALMTKSNDGHKYIPELVEQGVYNFVIQKYLPEFDKFTNCNFLLVRDSLLALQQIASFHRNKFELPVIGITGSNGKTIIKEWLYQLLNETFNIVRSPRSYNSQIGVPLSVWQLDKDSELGIFEAGISLPGEMERLETIIKPTIGILTNIGDAHQENFTSMQEKVLQKLILFKNCNIFIYDGDDHLIRECIKKSRCTFKTVAWSKHDINAPLFISRIQQNNSFTKIDYTFSGLESSIEIPFIDKASIENAIHCLAAILCLHPEIQMIAEKFSSLEPVDMRLDVKKGINNCILINDTYNSDIHSLEIAMDFMSTRISGDHHKSTLILSDILQSGSSPKKLYEKVMSLIRQKKINRIIGIGNDLMAQTDVFDVEKIFYSSTDDFLKNFNNVNFRDEVILIKGSRKFQFEKITALLEEKVHETILEVDLDALIHNFNYFKSKLLPSTKIICMIKAFGYGIGSYELAKTLQSRRCDYLAVAVADEGAELRSQGIYIPIMVMNPEMNAFNTIFQYHLEPEIYSFRLMDAFIKETERRGITNYPVHIKFDTGMHRLGFNPEDVEGIVSRLRKQKGIKVCSVFSHLAGSDSDEFDNFTFRQFSIFESVSSIIERELPYPVMKHMLNSAGIERFPEYQSDMVRLGIGLYGISAVDQQQLKTVATLKSTILQIREVEAGETVGYSRKGLLKRDSRIACIPIGYADGIDRQLGNGIGEFWVNGTLCPIVGNVCMDITMIDVTDAEAKEGDAVIVFGKEIPVTSVAEKLKTIPYEIFTSVSPRVKRVYFKE